MGFLSEAVEKKKQELIDQLIGAKVYQVNDQQLYNLTLSELQNELRKVKKGH